MDELLNHQDQRVNGLMPDEEMDEFLNHQDQQVNGLMQKYQNWCFEAQIMVEQSVYKYEDCIRLLHSTRRTPLLSSEKVRELLEKFEQADKKNEVVGEFSRFPGDESFVFTGGKDLHRCPPYLQVVPGLVNISGKMLWDNLFFSLNNLAHGSLCQSDLKQTADNAFQVANELIQACLENTSSYCGGNVFSRAKFERVFKTGAFC